MQASRTRLLLDGYARSGNGPLEEQDWVGLRDMMATVLGGGRLWGLLRCRCV